MYLRGTWYVLIARFRLHAAESLLSLSAFKKKIGRYFTVPRAPLETDIAAAPTVLSTCVTFLFMLRRRCYFGREGMV